MNQRLAGEEWCECQQTCQYHYTCNKVLVLRVTSDQNSRPLLFPIPLYSGMCLAVGYVTGGEHCCWLSCVIFLWGMFRMQAPQDDIHYLQYCATASLTYPTQPVGRPQIKMTSSTWQPGSDSITTTQGISLVVREFKA